MDKFSRFFKKKKVCLIDDLSCGAYSEEENDLEEFQKDE